MKHFYMLICFFALQACSPDMYKAGTLTPHRAQIVEGHYHKKYDLLRSNNLNYTDIQNHYMEYGEGSVQLVGFHDHTNSSQALVKNSLSQLRHYLQSQGLDVESELLPLQGQNSLSVSYQTIEATGPKDCTTMAGYSHTDIGNNADYNIGCTVEALIARQVSNPRDLLGKDDMDETHHARSSVNIINAYSTGEQNQPLGGYQASSE